MDIDKLEAGPTLDALIALEVMGFGVAKAGTLESLGFPQARGKEPSVFPPKCVTMGLKEDDNVLENGRPIPAYSTDIAAAWEVVSKFDWRYLYSPDGDLDVVKNGCWEVAFKPDGGRDRRYYATATTAPLAICRAALKAIDHTLVKR